MTDEDFDKVDEDFASEFDFVDSNSGGRPAAGGNAQSGGTPPPPKGSSGIITLMVIISILGGGYYAYTRFFASKPEAVAASAPAKTTSNELPTLPQTDNTNTPPASPMPPAAPPAPAPSADEVAEALNPKQTTELSQALPTSGGEKTFEQMQKDVQSAQQQAAPVAQPAPVSNEMRNALQSLSEEMTENVNNTRQLENTIANMASTLDQINKTIGAMDNRVLSLTETVETLSQDLSNVKRVMVDQDLDLTMPGNVKSTTSKKKSIQSIKSTEPNYSVHAIIPGRAWLKAGSGQIITVTEGDKIGDYGTVAVIDAANGLVRTSSGIIIR